MRRASAHRSLAWVSLAGVLAAACETLAPPPHVGAPPAREPESAPSVSTVRRASGTLAIRLSRCDGLASIEVSGAAAAAVRVERSGTGVALEKGSPRAEIVLAPRDARAGLRIGSANYAGALRVRPRAAGGLEITNLVELEDYVAGVVAAELAVWSAEPEELRAQAVAARSYAVAALDERGRKKAEPYLFDDVRDQVYAGRLELDRVSGGARRAVDVARAVASTRGVVLMEDDSVVDARFHAACGGATADGRTVFPETTHACLRSVECASCRGELATAREASSELAWRWTASRETLDALARRWALGQHVERIAPTRRDASDRWLEVELTGDARSKRVAFEELRRALDPAALKSSLVLRTWPRPGEAITGGVLFEGRGRGHGVGLCQTGARGYARAGWSAERILAHYYPGARLVDWR